MAEETKPEPDRFETLLSTIRERIISLEYAPGQRIGEEMLSREFHVSRTPIRRVLGRLEFEGFVEIRQGSGTYVTEISVEDVLDIYKFRIKLAELMGEFGVKSLPHSILEKLYTIRSAYEKEMRDLSPVRYRYYNQAWQSQMVRCIGNKHVRVTLNTLYYQTERYWHWVQKELDWDYECDAFLSLQSGTIRNLESGDVRGAGLFWREHLFALLRRIESFMDG